MISKKKGIKSLLIYLMFFCNFWFNIIKLMKSVFNIILYCRYLLFNCFLNMGIFLVLNFLIVEKFVVKMILVIIMM